MELRFVYMTAGSREAARRIGADLVERRFAACVNIIDGMESLYRWQGRVETAAETVLVAKTRADRVDALTARVRELHDYDCPCVVAIPLVGGNPDFLSWIAAETADFGQA